MRSPIDVSIARCSVAFAALLSLAAAGCDSRRGSPSDRADASLAELCEVHKTDKCSVYVDEGGAETAGHDYVEVYELFFAPIRHQAERVFEIGVLYGDSMRLWEAYFPNAKIFGIDIEDTSEHDTDRITTFVADQSDREQLGRFIETHGGDFDIVIDDGGHSMEQQQVSFGYLFPFVRPGGYYVIEDIHTSFFDPAVPGFGVEKDRQNTTFTMIHRSVLTGSFRSRYLSEGEMAYLDRHVDHCLYWYRFKAQSDLFLCRKKGGDR